jgi:hypothetical protein
MTPRDAEPVLSRRAPRRRADHGSKIMNRILLMLMEAIELVRALGNSYRLASSGPGSSFLYGRFAFNFCRRAVVWVAR